ncbi:MAG: glycoside hydrolase family 2 protein [Marinifilaceae bacterium]
MKRVLFLLMYLSVQFASNPFVSAQRQTISFNDGWEFRKGPFSDESVRVMSGLDSKWSEVTLPHTWNNEDMQKKYNSFYEGDCYYRKQYNVPQSMKGKQLFLRFEGVGQVAELWINGEYVGMHKGGYSAFAFDVTKFMKPDVENTLLMRVSNKARVDVIPVNHVLFGVYGGIYRPVTLVATEPVHIAVTDYASPGVYVTQRNVSRKGADVGVKVKLENKSGVNKNIRMVTRIEDAQGRAVAERKNNLTVSPQGRSVEQVQMAVRSPRLWHGRKDPYLYRVVVRLEENGQVIDEMVQPLGLRNYEIKAGDGFYLNGEKYPMYGVCRHQDWWGIGSALENKHHDHDLNEIMGIGATTVRFAHYQQSDYLYSRCDTLGLIIWAEIPFVNRVSTQESENAKSQMTELIRQSFNHPSIYIWGLHNEVYKPHEYTATLTRELHDLAKMEDPDRYTVAVNGYGHMSHEVNCNADIQGMNRYFGWYEKKLQDIKPWIQNLEKEYPQHAFILSEYGADANIGQQTEYLSESLNWTKPYYPETFQTKTHELHWSVIKDHPYIVASYLWNMFDFATPLANRGNVPARNMKGLITFDRKTKKDSYYFYKANWSEEPVLHITQKRLNEREKQLTNITVYSNKGVPTLTLNGTVLPAPTKGYTDIHYIFENVSLRKGENKIEAGVKYKNENLTDNVVWNYTHERKAGEAESLNSDKVHSGF